MLQQQPACISQQDLVPHSLKKACLVHRLQFLNMLGYSRLTNKQLLRSLCKAEVFATLLNTLNLKSDMFFNDYSSSALIPNDCKTANPNISH